MRTLPFAILILLIFFSVPNAEAQDEILVQNQELTEDIDSEIVVRRIRFSGNKEIKDRTLEDLIRSQTNREFLGIPRFTPWYYFYNLSNGRFGEDPTYLNRETVSSDLERIKLYYESLGFRGVQVDTTIVEYKRDRVEVSFLINEGDASFIESVRYAGMPNFSDPELRSNFLRAGALTRGRINDTTYTVNRQFSAQSLREEQERLIDFLKNNGFASVQRDSVAALVRPQESDTTKLDVQFQIFPGKIFRFGDIVISLADPELPDNYTEKDTLTAEPFVEEGFKINLLKEPGAQSRFSLLSDQILFKPGEIYNHRLYLNTVREYQNLGMLFIRRFGQHETDIQPDYSKDFIPSYFELQSVTKHSFSTEFFGMKRYGFGTGIGLDYTNNNVFGKAENLSITANASLEYVTSSTLREINALEDQSSLFRSYEIRSDYSVPRLNFPFAFLDNTRFFTNGLTRYSLSYSTSDQLFFDINSNVKFNLRYEVQHNDNLSSFLDLIELDVIDPSPTQAFIDNLRNEFNSDTLADGSIVDPIELVRILEDFEPQFSSVIRYTFRNQDTDIIKRNRGYFREFAVSLGGNIPYALDKFIITPDTLEGSLPALFSSSDNTLTYSRFFKLTADLRRYYPISNSGVFAWRFFGGIAQPYGQSTTIPLNRRFFAGGSNDIRGWAPFQLGPGNISSSNVTINGGEIKLAAFTEARQTVIRNLLGADWQAAWFVDAGNIWYGPRNNSDTQERLDAGRFKFDEFYKQIAVASGAGIRLDWEFLIVRFDFAFRVHDLDLGWFENKKTYFSFGIGHSF